MLGLNTSDALLPFTVESGLIKHGLAMQVVSEHLIGTLVPAKIGFW